MNKEIIYTGLAFVSFDEPSGSPSLDYLEVTIFQVELRTFELHCSRQTRSRQLIITPQGQASIQGNVIKQEPGITTFVVRS